ncbi:MAG: hypothetical protein NC548_22440 [Lachnospiraceae bacterium]|nr:hypothetical protein [Lachnospiraceae bacterium]
MLKEKFAALKNYLIESGEATAEELAECNETVYNDGYGTFEIIGHAYKVLTDEEADKATANSIREMLWAFNADFILAHSAASKGITAREGEEIKKALRMVQKSLRESANAFIMALISDMDTFVNES